VSLPNPEEALLIVAHFAQEAAILSIVFLPRSLFTSASAASCSPRRSSAIVSSRHGEAVFDERVDLVQPTLLLGVVACKIADLLQLLRDAAAAGVIRLEINGALGQEKSALSGLGIDQAVHQALDSALYFERVRHPPE
jgi:hypothetical protein